MVGSRWDVQVAIIARFKVLTVVLNKIQVWDITPSTGYTVTDVLNGYSASIFRVKQWTQGDILEDFNLHSHCYESLTSCIAQSYIPFEGVSYSYYHGLAAKEVC